MSLVSITWNKYKIWKVKQPLAQRFKAKPRATKPHPSRILTGTWVQVFYILLSGKKKTFVELLLQLGTTESKQPLSESAHKQELNDHSSEIHPKRRRAQTSPPQAPVPASTCPERWQSCSVWTSLPMANIQPSKGCKCSSAFILRPFRFFRCWGNSWLTASKLVKTVMKCW